MYKCSTSNLIHVEYSFQEYTERNQKASDLPLPVWSFQSVSVQCSRQHANRPYLAHVHVTCVNMLANRPYSHLEHVHVTCVNTLTDPTLILTLSTRSRDLCQYTNRPYSHLDTQYLTSNI